MSILIKLQNNFKIRILDLILQVWMSQQIRKKYLITKPSKWSSTHPPNVGVWERCRTSISPCSLEVEFELMKTKGNYVNNYLMLLVSYIVRAAKYTTKSNYLLYNLLELKTHNSRLFGMKMVQFHFAQITESLSAPRSRGTFMPIAMIMKTKKASTTFI